MILRNSIPDSGNWGFHHWLILVTVPQGLFDNLIPLLPHNAPYLFLHMVLVMLVTGRFLKPIPQYWMLYRNMAYRYVSTERSYWGRKG